MGGGGVVEGGGGRWGGGVEGGGRGGEAVFLSLFPFLIHASLSSPLSAHAPAVFPLNPPFSSSTSF